MWRRILEEPGLLGMHVRMGSEKMNGSILERYLVVNVGFRGTLINLLFYLQQTANVSSKYIKVNVSDSLL